MNPLLRALSHHRPIVGGRQLWSSVFAAAGSADIVVDSPVTFDITPAQASSFDHGMITVTSAGAIYIDQTKDTEFRAMGVMLSGKWECGTEAVPFPLTRKSTIVLSGARVNDPSLNTPALAVMTSNRGFLVMPGADFSSYTAVPPVVKFKLGASAAVGATTIVAETPVTFAMGDLLWLTSDKYYFELNGAGRELVVVASAVTNSVNVPILRDPAVAGTGLQFSHHGKLQYVVPYGFEDIPGTNLSYTYRAIQAADDMCFAPLNSSGAKILGAQVLASAAAGSPTWVDNRTSACFVSYPVTFSGKNDTDWTTHGYGASAHGVMGLSTQFRLRGMQYKRTGHCGFLGGYGAPHMHMRSYTPFGQAGSGTYLGAVSAASNYAEHFSSLDSSNRGPVIHGTCGMRMSKFVIANPMGHAIFFEDGSEQNNLVEEFTVSNAQVVGFGKTAIKAFDQDTPVTSGYYDKTGPAGIWYTNPYNTIRRGECEGCFINIWRAFSSRYYTGKNAVVTGTGNGTVEYHPSGWNQYFEGLTPFTEDITLTATSATTFNRTGSVSGALTAVTVGVEASSGPGTRGLVAYYRYTVIAGSVPFVAGDTITIQCRLNAGGCFGASRDVAIDPGQTHLLKWGEVDANFLGGVESHGARYTNTITGAPNGDEKGRQDVSNLGKGTEWLRYSEVLNPPSVTDTFTQDSNWKAETQGYVNIANDVRYSGWTFSAAKGSSPATGGGRTLVRGIAGGVFDHNLFAARTLDDANPTYKPQWMVSYDGAMTRSNSIVIGAPSNAMTYGGEGDLTQIGGIMALRDFYLFPVTSVFATESNTSILGANPGFLGVFTPPVQMAYRFPNLQAVVNAGPGVIPVRMCQQNCGARLLPADGSLFGLNGWWTNNDPYFTHDLVGTATFPSTPSGAFSPGDNGVVYSAATNHFCGFQIEQVNQVVYYDSLGTNCYYTETHYWRKNLSTRADVSSWDYPYRTNYENLGNMRGGTIPAGAWVDVRMPVYTGVEPAFQTLDSLPKTARIRCFFMRSTPTHFYLTMPWSGTATSVIPQMYDEGLTFPANQQPAFTAAASLSALLAQTGAQFFIDTAANKMHLCVSTRGTPLGQPGSFSTTYPAIIYIF